MGWVVCVCVAVGYSREALCEDNLKPSLAREKLDSSSQTVMYQDPYQDSDICDSEAERVMFRYIAPRKPSYSVSSWKNLLPFLCFSVPSVKWR